MPSVEFAVKEENGAAEGDFTTFLDSLIKERFSCRYFLDKKVEKRVVTDIFDIARFSPSGNNIQPWERVYCLSGGLLEVIRTDVSKAVEENSGIYKAEYSYYPPLETMPDAHAFRRQEFGRLLGQGLKIDRANAVERAKVGARNYRFYDAPVGLVFTLNKRLEKGSWIDLGYFLQSVSIAARSRGLETCSQESIAQYHRILRKYIPITDDEIVAVGMSMGYPDMELATRFAAPQPRREVNEILQFHDCA